jgi:putative sigma-54 modulation protein
MEVNVHKRPFSEEEEFNAEIDAFERQRRKAAFELPKIKDNKKRILKTLTTDEAIMKMELTDDHFMIFRDEKDRALKVIYRLHDGDYGIVCPQ